MFTEPRILASSMMASLIECACATSSFQTSTSIAMTPHGESRRMLSIPSSSTGARRASTSLPGRAANVAASAS
jgi:hypothetical protein